MTLSEILILGYIVAFFSAFVLAIGGVSTWIAVSDWRERAAKRGRVSHAQRRGGLKAA